MLYLNASPLASAEFARNCYFRVVGPDVAIDDVLRPAFWTHHAQYLRVHDMIEIIRDDGAFDVTLRVVQSTKGLGVSMRVLRSFTTDDASATISDSDPGTIEQSGVPAGFKIEWAGPKAKFRVKREMDQTVVHGGFATRDEAVAWAKDNAAFA